MKSHYSWLLNSVSLLILSLGEFRICLILSVAFLIGNLSFITTNSFAVKFGCFIEIETSCQLIILFSKLKIIPCSCSVSLLRVKS